ncbi:MAG TPA: DUF2066 domain-containing protein [Stellaceae bacterium]|nr:DUF2066 domain-containing protein [Stellaceae bacterium]
MRLGRAFFAVALLVLAARPAPAAAPDMFTVANVPVDATAANASAARDQARADGARRAYAILMARLTQDADKSRLPAPTEAVLNDIIAGFAVAGERASSVHYLAKYTYHFRPDAVRALLRSAGIPFGESQSKPLLALGVFRGGAAPVLWEDPNPWREAWTAHPPQGGLVPIVLPYGELEDVQAIDAAAALAGDQSHIQAISARYGGADVLVAVATLRAGVAPHTLDVKSTRYSAAGDMAPQSWTKTYVAAPDQNDAALFADAVAGTGAQVADAWKQANMLDYSKAATIMVRVPTGALDHFVDIRDRLAQIPVIQHSDLMALDRQQAKLALHYFGTPDQLRTALAQHDLALAGQDPDWVLDRRGAATTP